MFTLSLTSNLWPWCLLFCSMSEIWNILLNYWSDFNTLILNSDVHIFFFFLCLKFEQLNLMITVNTKDLVFNTQHPPPSPTPLRVKSNQLWKPYVIYMVTGDCGHFRIPFGCKSQQPIKENHMSWCFDLKKDGQWKCFVLLCHEARIQATTVCCDYAWMKCLRCPRSLVMNIELKS